LKLRDFLLFFVNYEEFEITSNLSREEVVQKIEDNIGQEKEFVFSIFNTQKEVKMFSGEVSKVNYTFKIKKNNRSYREVPPLIIGNIKEAENGSRIFIKIKLDFLYRVLIILLHFVIIIIFLAAYLYKKSEQENDFSNSAILLILLIFYLIRLSMFKFGAYQIEQILKKLL
jgi:hypothetical protein